MSERFLKIAEVQALLGVSRATVWRWTSEHGLKVVRVGNTVRIRETDLQSFLSRHEESRVEAETVRNELVPAMQNGS